MLQGEPDELYMLRKNFTHGISRLNQFNFTYDLLIKPQHLSYAVSLVKQFPNQKFVLDHIAKPDIVNKNSYQEWITGIKALSMHDNVWCKLSGMVTEANWYTWTKPDIEPFINHVLESFGPSRIMFGSDWPVCLVAASYESTLLLVEVSIQKLSMTEQEQIMGKTAVKFYNL
jgi:L-fuconolactonase